MKEFRQISKQNKECCTSVQSDDISSIGMFLFFCYLKYNQLDLYTFYKKTSTNLAIKCLFYLSNAIL